MISASLVATFPSHALAEENNPNAAALAYWDKVVAVCGGATYLYGVNEGSSPGRIDEFKGTVSYRTELDPPSPAERLNGLEWRAITSITSTVGRTRFPEASGTGARWQDWGDNPQAYVHIQNLNGRVTFNGLELSQIHERPSCKGADVLDVPPPAPGEPHFIAPPDPASAALSQESTYLREPVYRHPVLGELWWGGGVPLRAAPARDASQVMLPKAGTTFRIGSVNGQWAGVTVVKGDGAGASGYVAVNALAMKAF
jgi:hypothetical protein